MWALQLGWERGNPCSMTFLRVYTQMHLEARGQHQESPSITLQPIFWDGFSLIWLDWLGQWVSQDPPVYTPADPHCPTTTPNVYMGAADWNLGPLVFIGGAKPSPTHPQHFCPLWLTDFLLYHIVFFTQASWAHQLLRGILRCSQGLLPQGENKIFEHFLHHLPYFAQNQAVLFSVSPAQKWWIPFKLIWCYLEMNLKRNQIAQDWSGFQQQLGKTRFSRYQVQGIYPI